MADVKITELPAETAPDDDDLVEIVDDVAGTPTSKKTTIGQLPVVHDTLFDDAGDLVTATAADTPVRLAKGDPLDILQVNAGGTALEWAPNTSGVSVEDEGSVVVSVASSINFTGAGVTATNAGSGVADVDIPGGITSPDITEALVMTQAAYDALGAPDADTLYVIVG